MIIFAIDPGPIKSGWALFSIESSVMGGLVVNSNGHNSNLDVRGLLSRYKTNCSLCPESADYNVVPDVVVIEDIQSYGMAVGRNIFSTCIQIGRFIQTIAASKNPVPVYRLTPTMVRNTICHSAKAKKKNIRQSLIDRYGPTGLKRNPGPLYGVYGHAWSALAVGVTYSIRKNDLASLDIENDLNPNA